MKLTQLHTLPTDYQLPSSGAKVEFFVVLFYCATIIIFILVLRLFFPTDIGFYGISHPKQFFSFFFSMFHS